MNRSSKGLVVITAVVGLLAADARADYIDHFANPDDIGILKVPHQGTTRILVLPVVVDDLPFEQGSEEAFLEELHTFFDPKASGWAFTPYWSTMSLQRFHPEATVAAPVHFPSCPTLGAYEDCEIPRGAGFSSGDAQGAIAVLDDALTFMDEIFRCASVGPAAGLRCTAGGGVHFPDFDVSGPDGTPDTVVDGVIIVSNAGFPGIALPVKELATNALMQFFGPFPDFTYDGATVGAVAVSGRAELPQRSAWVAVHEFGHLLGYCDLYAETGLTTDMPYTLMGGWYYEDPGSLLDPFSRIAAGWGHVVQATTGTYEIGPADLKGTVLKVGTGEEFFLVELRRKREGVSDGDLSVDFGVLVERVRLQKRPNPARGNYLNTLSNCVNCTPFDTFLSIEQADGRFDLDNGRRRDDGQDLFQAGNEIGPSDDVDPRSLAHMVFSTNRLDGVATGLTIRVVEADAEHALIEVESPEVADACAEIAPWCADLPCADGACGEYFPPVEEPAPADPGCGCAAGSVQPVAPALAALAAALRGRRRRVTR